MHDICTLYTALASLVDIIIIVVTGVNGARTTVPAVLYNTPSEWVRSLSRVVDISSPADNYVYSYLLGGTASERERERENLR